MFKDSKGAVSVSPCLFISLHVSVHRSMYGNYPYESISQTDPMDVDEESNVSSMKGRPERRWPKTTSFIGRFRTLTRGHKDRKALGKRVLIGLLVAVIITVLSVW